MSDPKRQTTYPVVSPLDDLIEDVERLVDVLDAGAMVAGIGPMNETKKASIRRFADAIEELILSMHEIQAHHREWDGVKPS